MDNTVFKLYICSRSYGKEDLRKHFKKNFVMESDKMLFLLDFISSSDNTESTFIIEKFVNDKRQIRRLTSMSMEGGCWLRGDFTTTWEKYAWNTKNKKWKSTNFRYPDEIIV